MRRFVIEKIAKPIINRWELMCLMRRFQNIKKPAIIVKHKDLEPFDDGNYKRKCPKCKDGMLFVTRDGRTLVIAENDTCIACGQRIVYSDIDEMRKGDWLKPVRN